MGHGASLMVLLLALVLAPAKPQEREHWVPSKTGTEDIQVVVFHHAFGSFDLNREVYFLDVEGKDPSPDLLVRFKSNRPPVKPRSAAKRIRRLRVIEEIRDKKSGVLGVIFFVGKIRPKSIDELEIEAGYDCGSLCMGVYTYTVNRTKAGWVVARATLRIQS